MAKVKLVWPDAAELPIGFADQLHVTAVQGRFYLTFGQLNLPPMKELPDDFTADVRPIGRFVVPGNAMSAMIQALNTVVEAASAGTVES